MEERNLFLDQIGQHFHRQRPRIPEGLNKTVHIEREGDLSFVNLRFRSRGCHHNYLGGCTMCDYWVGEKVDVAQMVEFGREALSALDFAPGLLVFGPSGSMFDDWEVPPEARKELFRILRTVSASVYIFFSRADTITEEKLADMVQNLGPAQVSIEMGLETADSWKLKFCVNKAMSLERFATTVQLIKRFGLYSTAYILLGVPFLTTQEMIEDTIFSISWAFGQGVDYCVVFPVHIKPWTIMYWLYEHGMFQPVSLWALVEVLSRFTPEELKRIGISWYSPCFDRFHPGYSVPPIRPTTCPSCYDRVISILDKYRFAADRYQIIKELDGIECSCRDFWRKSLELTSVVPLAERVRTAYREMGINILGVDWWDQHGDQVLASVPDHI